MRRRNPKAVKEDRRETGWVFAWKRRHCLGSRTLSSPVHLIDLLGPWPSTSVRFL